jgi:hypothetical protein
MNSFGKFNLVGSDNRQVECSIEWIADARDWSFVDHWEKERAGDADPRIRDSSTMHELARSVGDG